MEHYLYLAVNLFSVLLPVVFSFHPKLQFHLHWNVFVRSNLTMALLFICWDVCFTRMGVWGFNERYLLGMYILGLPLEEILFFICIPFSCLFTFHCISLIKWIPKSNELILSSLLALPLMVLGVVYLDKWYTACTFLGLSLFLFAHVIYFRFSWMRHFYLSFVLILPFFFLTNGILTGYFTKQPVVWYNDAENLGIRLGSIPVEDVFYGMWMLMLNTCLFEITKSTLEKRKVSTLTEETKAQM